MLVASDDPRLGDESGTAAPSPFVIAASAAGISAIPTIVNAVVITSAFSSSNQALLAGTRVLYGLTIKRQAPSIFLRTNRLDVSYMCVFTYTASSFLAFMSFSENALTVFYWFMDLVGCGVLISWIAILTNHLRLVGAMRKQGVPISALPWSNRWTPYSSAIALVFLHHHHLNKWIPSVYKRQLVDGRIHHCLLVSPSLHPYFLSFARYCIGMH